MVRLKGDRSGVLLGLALLNTVVGRKINTTIYDTNTAHISYTPQNDFCVRWSNHIFWKTCDAWAKPWQSEVFRSSKGKLVTLHRSLDHEQPTMTIKFQGSAIWLYGPPRSQLPGVPVDHKICLHENHRVTTDIVCYRVDVAEAYSASENYDAPVVIFAQGGLQDQEHRLVVSVGDPVDEVDKYRGIQFSHAVYTIERPTPWPTDEDSWRFREVVMHDTHPLLSYSPKDPVSSGWWPWSPGSSGWFSKTYMAEDGSRVSWRELQSRGESNLDEWGVDATITAGVVAIYGIPKAHITATDSLSDICVRVDSGPCETIDVKHAYLNAEHRHEAVLLWRNQALDSFRQTHISVRLVKTGGSDLRVFPFKAFHYYETQEYSSPDPPMGQLENIAVAHDDKAIVYHPERRCVNYFSWWCTKWFDAWSLKEAGPPGSALTYRSTLSSYRATEDPSITLDFQGSAVYVYGAPKSYMKNGFASQHVCINNDCHVVDVEQAYLNAPESSVELTSARSLQSLDTDNVTFSGILPELDPVLIWSMNGLDDKVQHSLRLALAEQPSRDQAEMSIAKIVYTKVTYMPGQSQPDTPVPQPDYAYSGPLYPPHATKWAPRPPSPQPAPQPPSAPTQPPRQRVPADERPIWPFIFWPAFGAFIICSLVICMISTCESAAGGEGRRIRPRTPPPVYVPRPPAPPRPTPRPPRPNPPPVQPVPRPQPKPYTPLIKPSPAPPKPPSPKQPTHRYPSPDRAGPSSSHQDPNNHRSIKPIPKSDLVLVDPQRAVVPPKPPVKPKAVNPPPKDSNNLGPCPGPNIAPPRPEYNPQKQPPASNSSQKTPHSSVNIPSRAQSAETSSLAPSRNVASPIPDYRSNRSTSQAASSSIFTPAPGHTSSAPRAVAPSSRVQVDNVVRQPQPVVRLPPQVPTKPNHTSLTTSATPSAQTINKTSTTNRPSERVIQPPPATTPSAPINPQVVPNPPQHPVSHQTERQSTATTSRSESSPEESTYAPDSDIAQWAQAHGFRIDRLMNTATKNEQTGPRTRPRRNPGQTRNAMLPSNPTAPDTPDQGSAYWRAWQRNFEETGQLLPGGSRVIRGVVSENRREQEGGQLGGHQRTVPARNPVDANTNGNRAQTRNTHVRQAETGSEAPAIPGPGPGPGARRPRGNRRSNQARDNNGQR
ncbi:unnamed protein product [Rhizoctonia solani]|uniref:Transmembrane protein n=1 Tax=Rhizoctonia solani TaxID=456999 RepID=A0A8H3ABE3_9AGAM|nr:unnamed protein product [Rhizoctonia solani]